MPQHARGQAAALPTSRSAEQTCGTTILARRSWASSRVPWAASVPSSRAAPRRPAPSSGRRASSTAHGTRTPTTSCSSETWVSWPPEAALALLRCLRRVALQDRAEPGRAAHSSRTPPLPRRTCATTTVGRHTTTSSLALWTLAEQSGRLAVAMRLPRELPAALGSWAASGTPTPTTRHSREMSAAWISGRGHQRKATPSAALARCLARAASLSRSPSRGPWTRAMTTSALPTTTSSLAPCLADGRPSKARLAPSLRKVPT
mmetsp:Transcript_12046/g.48523  ORF Transcript_12046/g.48523 Transcript_12046/m.48523 type:complete len:261 (-) Transcript_12046:195-977(-)